ncbi:MAG: hypothetical protein HWE24_07770 [Oceanospirillaceae bacterium]|nr:hypothetical protein [Oceanospirillaceae bacterium]
MANYWDDEAKLLVNSGRHPLNLEPVFTIDEHATYIQTALYAFPTAPNPPAIVIAASGMCTGGRIVNYLKALLDDERNDLLFVSIRQQAHQGGIFCDIMTS